MVRKLRDCDTFPGAHRPDDEAGPDPELAPARPDGYRYERPHIADSAVHRLLDGLRAPRFPRSTTLPETDGQLAAHYNAGPHAVPAASPTLTPQPSVLVSTTEPPQPPRAYEETLITIPKKHPWPFIVTALMGVATGAFVLLVLLVRGHRAQSASTVRASTLAPSVSAILPTPEPPPIPLVTFPEPSVPVLVVSAPTASREVPRTVPKMPVFVPRRVVAKEPEIPRSSKIDRDE